MTPSLRTLAPAFLMTLALWGGLPAQAEKPDWAGKPGRQHEKHDRREDDRRADDRRGDDRYRDDRSERPRASSSPNVSVNIQIGGYFGEPQRHAAQAYYEPRFKAGNCPPGLAKKHNGCMPPGQAKKWRMGHALPRDVVYYPVPNSVSVQIGLPPAGYQYVRVAADILMIAVGTRLVVDAIEDLGRF